MAIKVQINGQGTYRQTEEKYSYQIEGYVTRYGRTTMFHGKIQYTNSLEARPVFGMKMGDKICFMETKKKAFSEDVKNLIHDIRLYNNKAGIGTVMVIYGDSNHEIKTYTTSMETVTYSEKHLRDEDVTNLKTEIVNLGRK